jgi:hypothetical protein
MTSEIIDRIKALHRTRRYALKMQAKIDRGIESFIRINATEWAPDAAEDNREQYNRQVRAIIAAARNGEGDEIIVGLVQNTDHGREPFDRLREDAELQMEKLARDLPVAAWIQSVRGAGLLGLATIIAEAGDLGNYSGPAKLWKRLGFAPYDGYAGSTWKRATWRPRALTADEWIENPFSGERYALMHQIAVWLINAQWIAAGKTGTGEGQPNGPYGELYARRRAHTVLVHPEWSKQHSRMDALRVAMKRFLADLWQQWRQQHAVDEMPKPRRRQRERPNVEA